MTPAFWCIIILIIVNYLLAGLGGWLTIKQTGRFDINQPRVQERALTGAAARIKSAQANGWEIIPVFAICIFIAHLAGVPEEQAALPAYLFLATRLLYILCYAFKLSPWRSLIFFTNIIACGWLIKMAVALG
ncbi:MAPEG family protein [Photobacterium indicum]|uniref:MAPEG family protein n=1 Tax=Photobacterium indicum TaxID=81447 RepID=A0A2T3LBW9_9GAMM|nr:MAPEG family protein [Photobacterium indicum]PSV48784.1 hypothetical protein C9J47_09780 [Photobacterium indicum]